jgi:excinuclease ABC subunit A
MLDSIQIRGARQHNLRDIDLEIPRNRLVVMTGVSGSGKSSLAFHTLYAEGQRRYVESLSAYARQFLDRLEKPDVDFIEGLSPAIAIEQRSSAPNPRSTVATSTEIYDYLRILYAAVGTPHDPETGEVVHKRTPGDLAAFAQALPESSRLIVLAPLVKAVVGDHRSVLEKVQRQGFVRVRIDGEICDIDAAPGIPRDRAVTIELVVDRLVVKEGIDSRLMDSIETALRVGGGELLYLVQEPGEDQYREEPFHTRFINPRTGFTLPELTPRHFSFNSHLGACPECHGLGTVLVPDPALFVPDPSKSINEGGVKTWWTGSKMRKGYHLNAIVALARGLGEDLDAPIATLSTAFKKALIHGTDGNKIGGKVFEGLADSAQRLLETSRSETTRRNVRRFMAPRPCKCCQGRRLRPEILAITIDSQGEVAGELGIFDLCDQSVEQALAWIRGLQLSDRQWAFCQEVVAEITKRLSFLDEVGLGYLTLSRGSSTLSGGEAQRIRLATQIGGGLTGVLYVLDEPSIGLHQRDNQRLIGTLERLRDLGNTVVVVEHDADIIRAADHIVDLGPGAGELGGKVVAQGTPAEIAADPHSPTGRFLCGTHAILRPKLRMTPPPMPLGGIGEEPPGEELLEPGWFTVHRACGNNLREVTASFPVGCLTCVTGVSGSGKSTLVDTTLRRAVFRKFYQAKDEPAAHAGVSGLNAFDKAIVIDQSPIGRSPRSNPATYVKVFDPIRDLFATLPASKVRGYNKGRFSFNVAGGRCEACKGDGLIKIDMHFLSDVYVTCEECRGRRYNQETLEITFKGRNIAEVLEMTVEEAARFFRRIPDVYSRLEMLREVGLGYLRLGQSATTLSGGEAQRVKLAAELGKKASGRTLYLLDEPTTGLHFADIEVLLRVLYRLRDAGNTLVVIEHNLDVIKCADWIIDVGPGGGVHGGMIVAEGTPEQVVESAVGETARFLAGEL